MNNAPATSTGLAETIPPATRWSRNRWLAVILLVFTAQAAFVFLLGEKKAPAMRAVVGVPELLLAGAADESIALSDPTLFARPHFSTTVWMKTPEVKAPSFHYTEAPRMLPFTTENLGAAFGQLMQTNQFPRQEFDFKPALELSVPVPPLEPELAQQSTMQVEGGLARRQLPAPMNLTNWPFADVLPASVVQVLVDASGRTVSAVMLTPSGYEAADQQALAIVRQLRFTPAAEPVFGRITFNWHTVPPTTTP